MKKQHLLAIKLMLLAFIFACNPAKEEKQLAKDPLLQWPHGVTYEIFIHAFADSDGDQIGDIQGMTKKLDYLADLGIEAVWLMPIHPSPSYHKYDVTDYKGIHPDYGTIDDFKNFIKEAHARNIKVVIDFVINHTARDHYWFQEAMKGPDNPYRDYYVWAKREDIEANIAKKEITLDSDNITQWHEAPGNEELYYGFFWGGMPDLNFDNPKVKEEIFDAARFWLAEVGVDGFRLDAAKHIFPDERAKDNHAFWVEFRSEMEAIKPDVYLIGEVWSDAETVAPYIAGLPALFNFDLCYAITDVVKEEKNTRDIVNKLQEIREYYMTFNEQFVDATFLRNHDQNRILSELNGDVNKNKLAAAILFTLPGSPYLYYGEEIGMLGQKPDEHIREAFIWDYKESDIHRAEWVSPKYSTDESVIPLVDQLNDTRSMFHYLKTLIQTRKEHPALTAGNMEPTSLQDEEVISFFRSYGDEHLLVYHNLSGKDKVLPLTMDGKDFERIEYMNNPTPKDAEKRSIILKAYSSVVLKTP